MKKSDVIFFLRQIGILLETELHQVCFVCFTMLQNVEQRRVKLKCQKLKITINMYYFVNNRDN